jgi:hypothetical protein
MYTYVCIYIYSAVVAIAAVALFSTVGGKNIYLYIYTAIYVYLYEGIYFYVYVYMDSSLYSAVVAIAAVALFQQYPVRMYLYEDISILICR